MPEVMLRQVNALAAVHKTWTRQPVTGVPPVETVETTSETTIRGTPVHTRSDTNSAIATWLACTLKAPDAAHQEWTDNHVAMLPLGVRFDAVRIPAQLIHAAAGTSEPNVLGGFLAEVLGAGPVIHDPQAWFYALVPPRTTATWRSPLARCLGRGSWLGVPRVSDDEAGAGPYWAVPLMAAGELCTPHEVAELLVVGRDRSTPNPPASETCSRCHEPTQQPTLAGIEHASSGAGRNVYTCPRCRKPGR